MPGSRVDVEALYGTLNRARTERGQLSWRQVARQAGVGPSTLSRLAQGHRPDVDSFAALVHWLGMPAEDFMRHAALNQTPPAVPTTEAVASLLRGRRDLDPVSADAIGRILDSVMKLAERRASH